MNQMYKVELTYGLPKGKERIDEIIAEEKQKGYEVYNKMFKNGIYHRLQTCKTR